MNHSLIALSVIVTVLLVIFGVSMYWALRGDATARYVVWIWATGLVVSMFLKNADKTGTFLNLSFLIILVIGMFVIYVTRENLSEKLNISHAETRRVLDESNRRIDEELKTIARRLHDEINHSLLIAARSIKSLERHLVGNDDAIEKINTVSEMLNQAYSQARDIIKNTRIEIIDSIGLTAALESLISHFSVLISKTTIKLDHNLPKRPLMDGQQAVGLYKVVREAVLNAIKHANATSVKVSVMVVDEIHYEVSIVDNGEGIARRRGNDDSSGIGLLDMRERVRALGGSLKIQSVNANDAQKPGTAISFTFDGLRS